MDLITRRVPVKSIGLPEWATKVLKEHDLGEEVKLIRKGITPEDTKFNENERSSVDYITTKTVDRDGEIVVPKGAILDHYRNNPVVLFGHNYKELPIGKSLWIKLDDKGLISKTQYAKHSKADDIYQYRKDGFPMAKSIGFIPLEVVEEADFGGLDLKALGLSTADLVGANRIYPKWLMLEYSDVPIPSNPDALQLAISKGILTLEEAKVAAEEDNAFVIELISTEAVEKAEPVIVIDKEVEIEEPTADIEDLEKRYGKEAFAAYSDEAVVIVEPKPLVFKSVEGADGPWNKEYKELNIVELEAEPSSAEYDIAAKWLDCEVKDIFVHSRTIPSAEMGSYLTGLNEVLKDFELITTRNFMSDGSESPLEYSIIQLTSEKSSDFLISGMEFYAADKYKRFEAEGEKIVEKDSQKVIIKRRQTWYGFQLTAYSTNSNKGISIKLFSGAQKWADENNFLKGECFALSGKFLKKSDDDWSDLFLDTKNESAIKRTTSLINEKGADLVNRGIILMGPPGTGKTLSGRIIRNKSDVTFIWVSARDFVYTGSVGGIGYGFSLARKLAPTILFIEDVDNWLDSRTTDLMKTEMDGITQSKGVVTMLTSNYPELLPPALIDRPGRFHDVLNFSLPSAEIRLRMIKAWTSDVSEKAAGDFVTDTVGFSGAHMYELAAFAKTIMSEEEISMEDALAVSLKKILEQRELIDSIRQANRNRKGLEYEKSVKLSQKLIEEIEEKAGKVLSKETRKYMQLAIDHMGQASAALCELFTEADKKDPEPEELPEVDDVEKEIEALEQDDVSEFEIEVKKEETFEVDPKMLSSAIAEALKATLSSHLNVNAGDIVKERLDKATGKIY